MGRVIVELCQSNSIGNQYHAPRVVSWQAVTRQEADEILARRTANGFYYREQPGCDEYGDLP